ncbi:MAG: PadR family transcriptional regulator [Nitrospirae bacterium]|nr:PadR family transcriptional regulator [Nitrospirota bacterium]
MALKHLILARLMRRPAHGYELHHEPLQPLHPDFGVTEAHIYASLRSLEKNGYVRHRSVRRGKFPQRMSYSITSKGRKYLRVWAKGLQEEPPEAVFGRSLWHPLGARLSVLLTLGSKPSPETLRSAVLAAQNRIRQYRSLLAVRRSVHPSTRILLLGGLALEKAGLSWLRTVHGEGGLRGRSHSRTPSRPKKRRS